MAFGALNDFGNLYFIVHFGSSVWYSVFSTQYLAEFESDLESFSFQRSYSCKLNSKNIFAGGILAHSADSIHAFMPPSECVLTPYQRRYGGGKSDKGGETDGRT